MYACGRCHERRECPAGRHERTYWARCELCGDECQCYDCMPGEKKPPPPAKNILASREIYLNVKRVHYPSKGKKKE